MNDDNFMKLYYKAHQLALEVGKAHTPDPMIVISDRGDGQNDLYRVPDGPCGFAWIKVTPGNCKFANWLKKSKLARKSYSGGVDIWVSEFGQSYERKLTYARSFARSLNDVGIQAVAGGRLD